MINHTVFLSLLSMDSYNRGLGSNINGLAEFGALGTATIRPFQPDEQTGWQAAGFYAIAYDWNGTKIISYRGTNPQFGTESVEDFVNSPILRNIWNGWTLGAGFEQAAQAQLAIQFYEDVTGHSIYDRVGVGARQLVGHSLGGGLAGFVGALSLHQRQRHRRGCGPDHRCRQQDGPAELRAA